ncbi:hypothetical protein GCM10027346_06210 [Hymenobacter seoulensis]
MGTVKRLLLLLLVQVVALLAASPQVQAQCSNTPNSGACFKVFDAITKQELPATLCVGRAVRLRDCSGKNLNPAQIYYQTGSSIICSSFRDTATTFTPTTPGSLVITQNTQGTSSQGVILGQLYTVRETPEPTFTLTTCSPDLVEVTVTDTNYDQYFVQVGTDAPQPALRGVPKLYSTNTVNSVTVTARYTDATLCSGGSTRPFTLPPRPQRPSLNTLTVQGTAIDFRFSNLQAEYRYVLQVADAAAPAGYRTVAPIPSSTTSFTLSNAPLPGCYRLLPQDACQTSANQYPASSAVCTIALAGASQNGRNQLRWNSTGTGSYILSRTDGQNTTQLQVPPGASQYEDTTVACGTTYRYRLSLTMGNITSTSNEVAVTTSSTLAPPAPRIFASFTLRNQVALTATVPRNPTAGQLTYLRNGTELRVTPQRTVQDSSLLAFSLIDPVCYTVRFLDACGNQSAESAPVCPVLLEATAANDDGTTIRLNWTAFSSPDATAGVTYRVITLSPTNAVLSSRPVGPGLTYLDVQPPQEQQVVRYRIEASAAGLPAPSYSNIASVARQVKLYVPTAFTPNADGLNDVLELKGRYLDTFRFTIIDRNGQQVFQATSRAQTWDGRIGSAAPVPGAYIWRFETTDQTGKRLVQNGTVTIIR